MFSSSDEAPALPMWINGRAFLTMTKDFYNVVQANTGKTLRRVPLCGAHEVAIAVGASAQALADWVNKPLVSRIQILADAAAILAQPRYTQHFCQILMDETGMDKGAAEMEVAYTLDTLRQPKDLGNSKNSKENILGLVTDATQALAAPAALIARACAAGCTAVIKPSPRAPSAAFALVELCSRAGLPGGVLNLVQGDDAAVLALAEHPQIAGLLIQGKGEWCEQVQSIAAKAGKPCQADSVPPPTLS